MPPTSTRRKSKDDVLTGIMEKVTIQENGCWEWTGKFNAGCPYAYYRRKKHHVTKTLWQAATETPYPFRKIEMSCKNGLCVNPAHVVIDETKYEKMLLDRLYWYHGVG